MASAAATAASSLWEANSMCGLRSAASSGSSADRSKLTRRSPSSGVVCTDSDALALDADPRCVKPSCDGDTTEPLAGLVEDVAVDGPCPSTLTRRKPIDFLNSARPASHASPGPLRAACSLPSWSSGIARRAGEGDADGERVPLFGYARIIERLRLCTCRARCASTSPPSASPSMLSSTSALRSTMCERDARSSSDCEAEGEAEAESGGRCFEIDMLESSDSRIVERSPARAPLMSSSSAAESSARNVCWNGSSDEAVASSPNSPAAGAASMLIAGSSSQPLSSERDRVPTVSGGAGLLLPLLANENELRAPKVRNPLLCAGDIALALCGLPGEPGTGTGMEDTLLRCLMSFRPAGGPGVNATGGEPDKFDTGLLGLLVSDCRAPNGSMLRRERNLGIPEPFDARLLLDGAGDAGEGDALKDTDSEAGLAWSGLLFPCLRFEDDTRGEGRSERPNALGSVLRGSDKEARGVGEAMAAVGDKDEVEERGSSWTLNSGIALCVNLEVELNIFQNWDCSVLTSRWYQGLSTTAAADHSYFNSFLPTQHFQHSEVYAYSASVALHNSDSWPLKESPAWSSIRRQEKEHEAATRRDKGRKASEDVEGRKEGERRAELDRTRELFAGDHGRKTERRSLPKSGCGTEKPERTDPRQFSRLLRHGRSNNSALPPPHTKFASVFRKMEYAGFYCAASVLR